MWLIFKAEFGLAEALGVRNLNASDLQLVLIHTKNLVSRGNDSI
jgi:hypothetical protein